MFDNYCDETKWPFLAYVPAPQIWWCLGRPSVLWQVFVKALNNGYVANRIERLSILHSHSSSSTN